MAVVDLRSNPFESSPPLLLSKKAESPYHLAMYGSAIPGPIMLLPITDYILLLPILALAIGLVAWGMMPTTQAKATISRKRTFKGCLRVALASSVSILPIVAFVLIFYWPTIQGWREVGAGMSAIKRHDLQSHRGEEVEYGANTFTNECEPRTMRGWYDRAASALVRHFPNVRTYAWSDLAGWGRVSAVAQGDHGYVEVRASSNNDNDSVVIRFAHGEFERASMKALPNTDLPAGMLR